MASRFNTPPPARPANYFIERPEQLAAIASPARQEVLDAAQALGRCSIAEIAEVLGRPADGLYYHVKALAKVGLLLQVGERSAGRRTEAVYTTPGRRMRLKHDGKRRDAVARVARSAFRLADRDLARALSAPKARTGPGGDTWAGRIKGWATDQDIREINSLIEQIMQRIAKPNRARNARLVAFAFALAPIEAKPRRRAAPAGKKGASS